MSFDLIIAGGAVVREPTPSPGTPGEGRGEGSSGVTVADIAISDGKIVEVAPSISGSAKKCIDASNLVIFPGLIDSHVHFNEPGRTDWEGIATGSSALAAGGGTCFFDMPLNSTPPVLDGPAFDAKRQAAEASSVTDFGLWGGLTPINLDRMEELAERGVVGFKAFMCDSGIADFPRVDDWTLERGMSKAAELNLPVAVHAENQELVAGKTEWMRDRLQTLTARDWVFTRSPLAEADAIQRAALIAQFTRCDLHIVHVSNRYCVELIRQFRGSVAITCETCPHYLELTAEDVERIGPAAKCAPPIRVAPQHEQLWQQVAAGNVDLISSDHSPAPPPMKSGADFFAAWGGISGVQSTLSILLTHRPVLKPELIAHLTSSAPAKRFKIPNKGRIEPGYDADLTLVDVEKEYELTRKMLLDRHKLSPYVGMQFRGLVRRTIVRGKTVFRDGKIVSKPIGKLVRPTR